MIWMHIEHTSTLGHRAESRRNGVTAESPPDAVL